LPTSVTVISQLPVRTPQRRTGWFSELVAVHNEKIDFQFRPSSPQSFERRLVWSIDAGDDTRQRFVGTQLKNDKCSGAAGLKSGCQCGDFRHQHWCRLPAAYPNPSSADEAKESFEDTDRVITTSR
jgi:hypothetical protein